MTNETYVYSSSFTCLVPCTRGGSHEENAVHRGGSSHRWNQFGRAGGASAAVGNQAYHLQQHDLGIAGREVVQVRVDFSPGVAFGRHTHPGEEIVYVLEGSLETRWTARRRSR